MERKIIRRGETFIVKEFLKEKQLKDFDIIYYLDNTKKTVEQIKNKINALENELEANKEAIKQHEKIVEDLLPFENETRTRLTEKLKSLIKKHKDEVINEVKSKVVKDVGVSDEQYKLELFNAYRRGIHTHPSIAKEIPDSIIRDNLYGNKTMITPKDI